MVIYTEAKKQKKAKLFLNYSRACCGSPMPARTLSAHPSKLAKPNFS
jgi:hypothetical protein